MSPGTRAFWIGLIAAGAAFSAGMYLAGMEAIARLFDSPAMIVVTSIVSLYVAFFALVLTNKNVRDAFLTVFRRSNRLIGNVLQSLVGVNFLPSDINRAIRPSDLREYIDYVTLSRAETQTSALSAETQAEIVGIVRDELSKNLKSHLLASVKDAASKATEASLKDEPIRVLENNYFQIRGASSTVTIRGFVNLVIGIGFALGALFFLRESVVLINIESVKNLTPSEVTYVIGTRVSLSLIITIIAYFFLSLYRKSLDDVKYYQNELTYISGRLAALKVALAKGDSRSWASVIPLLMDADRNVARPVAAESDGVDYEKLLTVVLEKLPKLK